MKGPYKSRGIYNSGVGKPVIMVTCDYCGCRQPFEILRGGQLICLGPNGRHNVNSKERLSVSKPEPRSGHQDGLLDFT